MKKFLLVISFLAVSLIKAENLSIITEEKELTLSLQEIDHLQAWCPWSSTPPKDVNPKPLSPFNVLELENNLREKVIGQSQAVENTANALLCYYAGINDPNKPIASFLYVGPTGVGKTELAKELARQLFQDETKLLRFDMSEYESQVGINRLIGVPNGYKDSEHGGLLSNAILANPHAVVLLDEIEKADPKVRALFLHIFDEGYFTSGVGELVDCRNCVFIATTNLASQAILNIHPFSYEKALDTIEIYLINALTPEFYNRIEPVIFQGLDREMMKEIAQIKLNQLAQNILKQKKVKVYFDEFVVDYIQTKGYHPALGARPMQRLIKNELTPLIAKTILHAQYLPGDVMHISYLESELIISRLAESEANEILSTNP
ncbi:AAA family ATPase [Candidatus Protochlamydia amoebophila]|nr:AAA family ATPase [Candidatus Protochlamydia amoebophila]